MEKVEKLIIKIFFCLIILSLFPVIVEADVGNYESYDFGDSDWDFGGSDWGGSDWDFGDSDWDYDDSGHHSSYSSSRDNFEWEDVTTALGFLFFIFIITLIINKNKPDYSIDRNYIRYGVRPNKNPQIVNHSSTYKRSLYRSEVVAKKIKEIDPLFDENEFLSWVKSMFVKMQNAWEKREWEPMRTFESDSLFEQHLSQIKEYIDKKQINQIDGIDVHYAELVSFNQDNEKDMLEVALNVSMVDYIKDENTNEVIKGNKETRIMNTYKMIFTRKKGVLTQKEPDEPEEVICPNCGAKVKVTISGKCDYCQTVITTYSHGWILNDMERW